MLDCIYCGKNTQNRDVVCNSCKNKLNAKKYLKSVLIHFKPGEVFSKRNLGLYLERSLNVDIVLLTLNDYGMVVRRGGHGYKLATKKAIDEFLSQEDLTLIKSKKAKKSAIRKSQKTGASNYSNIKKESTDNENVKLKKCKICGSDLPKNSKNDVCRRCSKKSHAINVLEEIIPITGVGIEFKKDDLNNLYKNNPIKANDTIWTLQDFNLVKSIDSNTFKLVSEVELNQFFKENNSSNTVSDLLSKTPSNSLQKTCLKCNKALPISEFRKISENEYSDYCKSCDKKIRTVNYAIEFIDSVGFNEFKINDINIDNVQGKIFNLQDNDLITFDGQFYQLVDEDIIYSYINQNSDDSTQFENILNAFKEDVTMIQAANSVGVSNVDVVKFYIEGKNGNPKYVHFFSEINKIKKDKLEKKACPKCNKKSGYDDAKCNSCGYVNLSLLSLDKKIDFVLAHIKENNSVKAAKELNIPYENVKNWNKLGKSGISPYDRFYNGIINIKNESKENAIRRKKIEKIESRLNEYLRKIQRTELSLDKNILELKGMEISNKKIKSEYDEIYSEINIMKNDLIFQKNEIKSIKEDLPKYSPKQLDNVKSFNIKGTSAISLKVDELIKKNDALIQKNLAKIKKSLSKHEKIKLKIVNNINEINNYILELNEVNFVESLKSECKRLLNELHGYESNLDNDLKIVEKNISELKSNHFISSSGIVEVNFIDYSTKVNNLINKNEKCISKQMRSIIDNLDDKKDLNQLCSDLKISYNDFELWCDLGKSGNKDFVEFYEEIIKFKEKLKEKSDREKLIKDYEKLIYDINSHIKITNNDISKLNKTFFVKSLKSDKFKLIGKLNDYILQLKSYEDDINWDLSILKNTTSNLNFKDKNIDFIDYSDEVNDLISKNQELISKQMKLIIDNLDESKELRTIYTELNIPYNGIKVWMNLGKEGNEDYVEFYEKITEFKKVREKLLHEKIHKDMLNRQKITKASSNNENGLNSNNYHVNQSDNNKSSGLLNKLVNRFSDDSSKNNSNNKKSSNDNQKELFLKYYEETKDFKKAANLANIQLFLAKFWYNSGERGDEQFIEFYNQVNRIKKP